MTEPDKGNYIVILNKEGYEQIIRTFLVKENFIKLKSDPTNIIQYKLKTIIKIEYHTSLINIESLT